MHMKDPQAVGDHRKVQVSTKREGRISLAPLAKLACSPHHSKLTLKHHTQGRLSLGSAALETTCVHTLQPQHFTSGKCTEFFPKDYLSMMAFSSLARIWGEDLIIHSLPALSFFFFIKWRSASTHQSLFF